MYWHSEPVRRQRPQTGVLPSHLRCLWRQRRHARSEGPAGFVVPGTMLGACGSLIMKRRHAWGERKKGDGERDHPQIRNTRRCGGSKEDGRHTEETESRELRGEDEKREERRGEERGKGKEKRVWALDWQPATGRRWLNCTGMSPVMTRPLSQLTNPPLQ